MPNPTEHPSVSEEARQRRHEVQNPSTGRIWLTGAVVVLMVIVCLGIIWSIMGYWVQTRPLDTTARDRGIIIAPNLEPLRRFQGPDLQVDPHDDLVVLQARDELELTTYGWVDREAGIVRVPLERAKELVLERGLPTRSPDTPPRTGKSPLELIRERSEVR